MGCGSNTPITPTPTPTTTADFTLSAAPSTITLTDGSAGTALSVVATATGGFTSPVTLALGALPTGITATPATLSLTPGQIGQVMLAASGAAVTASTPVTLTGTSGTLTHSATAMLAVNAAPVSVADFTLSAAPSTITLTDGSAGTALSVLATATGDFTSPVALTIGKLPTGITATPATLSLTPGQIGQVVLAASGAAATSSAAVTLTGTSGTLTHSATAMLAVNDAPAPPSTATLSTTSFDFGGDLVGSVLTKPVVTLTNTGTSSLTLSPTLAGDSSYSLVPASSCGATLAAGASCAETISYTPTVASGTTPQTATLNLGLGNVAAGTSQTVMLTGVSAVLPQGTVTATNNPQVALYTMTLPFPGSITVNFGLSTTYGRSTWSQATTTNGGQISMLVAGMLPTSAYHMQAAVQLANGVATTDVDHTFTTGSPFFTQTLSVTTTPGLTPQPGVEELTFIEGVTGLAVSDLQGGILWTYVVPAETGSQVQGAKLLPNGHFLLTVGQNSAQPLTPPASTAGMITAIREVDLAGNIIRELSVNDLTAELQAAGHNLTLQEFHHDVTPLPNGHWLILSNTVRQFTNLPGYPGVTNVLGDIVIDVDQNLQPVWIWDEFDHLDVNRHPMGFPDWTHTNAIVYSPSDGNLFISMRHQNWVLKVDYANGTGAGDVLWRLGQGGDFTLQNGVDPTDWNYAQHYPYVFSTNSSGNFLLGLMDNGNDRLFPTGVTCGAVGAPACVYTTVPVFQIDEGAKTATLVFHQILPTSLYSDFGGNTELLSNSNIEYDLAGSITGSDIFEVTQSSTPETVWHMHTPGSAAYRGYRIPSLYPGVQW